MIGKEVGRIEKNICIFNSAGSGTRRPTLRERKPGARPEPGGLRRGIYHNNPLCYCMYEDSDALWVFARAAPPSEGQDCNV